MDEDGEGFGDEANDDLADLAEDGLEAVQEGFGEAVEDWDKVLNIFNGGSNSDWALPWVSSLSSWRTSSPWTSLSSISASSGNGLCTLFFFLDWAFKFFNLSLSFLATNSCIGENIYGKKYFKGTK